MADNKKQHFVPKFLLKNFSNSNDDIGMVRIDETLKMMVIDYKPQCQKNYFYGEDLELEKKFGGVEGLLSNITRVMITNYWVPSNKLGPIIEADKVFESIDVLDKDIKKNKSKECEFVYYWFLLYFCFLQEYRTPKFKSRSDDLHTQLIRGIIKRDDKLKGNLLSVIEKYDSKLNKFEILENIIRNLNVSDPNVFKNHFESVRIAANENTHLTFKLLINCTGKSSFIISDHPAFLHGGVYKNINGVKFLLPLSPDVCLIAYDSKICKIGLKKRHFVVVSEYNDLLNINLLQYLNCQKNIYCNYNYDLTELYAIENMHRSKRDNPPKLTINIVNGKNEYELDKERPYLKFSFLKKIR